MSEPTLDLKEFLDRVQQDKDLLLELLDIFTDDFKQKRVLLGTAVKQNDHEQVRSIAHSIKGASGNISAKAVRLLCLKLEEMGKVQSLAGAEQIIVDLDKQFALLENRITEVKAELQS